MTFWHFSVIFTSKKIEMTLLPGSTILLSILGEYEPSYQKMYSKLSFFDVEMPPLQCPKVVYLVILIIFRPSDPLKSPIYQHRSTPRSSYSPKSLQKIVLPENGFISIYFEVKVSEKCRKVIFHVILAQIGTISPPST